MTVIKKDRLYYRNISHDITSNCNIRCRFCFNRWYEIGPNVNMTPELFEKVLPLLMLVREECFYFSCLYEPTLNKDMEKLIRMIPSEQRKKCFFTTNLAVRMPDSLIDFLSSSGLHHINISMESLDRVTYEDICEHAKFDTYTDNLERIVKAFADAPDAPKLRYITMILKENYRQLPQMAETVHEKYLADLHEFRTPYVGPHMNLPWLDGQILTRAELDKLSCRLRELSVPVALDMSTSAENYHEIIEGKKNREVCGSEPEQRLPDQHTLRIHSDGTIVMDETGEAYQLDRIEDPYGFFLEKLRSFYKEAVREERCREDIPALVREEADAVVTIDEIVDSDGIVTVSGWTFLEDTDMADVELFLRTEPEGSGRNHSAAVYRTVQYERPDVEAAYHSVKYRRSGFRAVFDRAETGNAIRIVMMYKIQRDREMWCLKKFEEVLDFS